MQYKEGDSVIIEITSAYRPRYAILSKSRELDMTLILQDYRRDDPVVMAIIWSTKFKYQHYTSGRTQKVTNNNSSFDLSVNLE
jgi:ribosomal protein L21E